MREYVCAPDQDVVISSRVRLSRNFEDLPFSPKLSKEYANEVINRTSNSVFSSKHGTSFMLLRMADLADDARNRLVEHHFISYDLLKYANRSAAMVSSAGTVSVMMNEEDHVRFQGLLPGLQLERSAEMALTLDEKVGDDYPYAFDSQWGFLTACCKHRHRYARLRNAASACAGKRRPDGRRDPVRGETWPHHPRHVRKRRGGAGPPLPAFQRRHPRPQRRGCDPFAGSGN